MFKHILLPTDGSELSADAIRYGVGLARSLDAKVTGIHVIPEYHIFASGAEMLVDTKEQYDKEAGDYAKQFLRSIESAAEKEGVTCNVLSVTSDHPFEAIIKAAEDNQCDLIAMASHGRRGLKGALIGSETQKVLTHTSIPVLVLRKRT